MNENVKGRADNPRPQSIGESAHLIWLAGIGAFAKISSEGGKLFEALVREGEQVEKRTRAAAGEALDAARAQAEETRGQAAETWDQVERLFEDRLARTLGRLGVPGRDDLQELIRRVDALQAQLDALRGARENQP
jgi:poly(hydroxyalkanoate) granule-associated protein